MCKDQQPAPQPRGEMQSLEKEGEEEEEGLQILTSREGLCQCQWPCLIYRFTFVSLFFFCFFLPHFSRDSGSWHAWMGIKVGSAVVTGDQTPLSATA